jgi:hypothetical protein
VCCEAYSFRDSASFRFGVEFLVAVLALDCFAGQGSLELSRRDSHIAFRTMAGSNRHAVNWSVTVALGRRSRQQNVRCESRTGALS